VTDVKHPVNWDFFISYTQADRAWAEWMAWVLEETGYRSGVTQASRIIAVLSDVRAGCDSWLAPDGRNTPGPFCEPG
jgi:hypothetical protein